MTEAVARAGDAMGAITWDPDSSYDYHGICFKCVDDTDMFTADVFPSLQVGIYLPHKVKLQYMPRKFKECASTACAEKQWRNSQGGGRGPQCPTLMPPNGKINSLTGKNEG